MRSRRLRWIIACVLGAVAGRASADDACAGFRWDVGHERALFATVAQPVSAGSDAESAPTLVPDRLYEIEVVPQQKVKFPVPPGKEVRVDAASAGLARLHVTSPGDYRVSLDRSFWVDVVAGNRLVPSKDAQGRAGCQAPHKIVLYSLAAEQDLILQFSGEVGSSLRLTITRAAAVPAQ
jgi:hypothetical protein